MTSPRHPHAMTIETYPHRVKVIFHEKVIADTQQALVLKEGSLPPVLYLPRRDVVMAYLERTTHSTHCPFKGDASYFTVNVDGRVAENAAWSYETPLASVSAIKDHIAFYREKIDAIEETPSER